MKRTILILLTVCVVLLTACAPSEPVPETTTPVTTQPPETTASPTTHPPTETILPTTLPPAETTVPDSEPPETEVPTESEHSWLYIPGLCVEDVILYFNEVCLDAEFSDSGDPSKLQKWEEPLYYSLDGPATEEDLEVLTAFIAFLNTIDGFPGIYESELPQQTNLQIYFRTSQELVDIMGSNFAGCDGGVTFWYLDNAIYDATICYSTDVDQFVRNSVILEEIYNGLGPVQDTQLRTDSIIYAGYSEPQELTEIDKLLLILLYHPKLECGMDAAQCEAVIRELYY